MPSYKIISPKIHEIKIDNPNTKNQDLKWVNIVNAGKDEIRYLRQSYNFDMVHLSASSGDAFAQRTVFKRAKNYLFIILHFPFFKGARIETMEVEIFLGSDYVITIHNDIQDINNFFNLCKKDESSSLAFTTESPRLLLYEIMEKLMSSSLDILDEMSMEITKAEKNIFDQEEKMALINILNLRRNIVNFRKIMQNHANIIQKIMNLKNDKLISNKDLRSYYNNLLDYSRHIWNISENRKEVIEILNSTNESLINHRLNNIMKILTIFSVIILPLSLMSGIFGMNVTVPFAHSPHGFLIITGLMLFITILMAGYFKIKQWF